MDPYRRQQGPPIKQDNVAKQSYFSDSRGGAGYSTAADHRAPPHGGFPTHNLESSYIVETGQGAGATTRPHIYAVSGTSLATSRSPSMKQMDRSLPDAPVTGPFAPDFTVGGTHRRLGASVGNHDGGRHLPAQVFPAGLTAMPAAPHDLPTGRPHNTNIYPAHICANYPPPQAPTQQHYPQLNYLPNTEDSTLPAFAGVGGFPSFTYSHAESYAAPVQDRWTPGSQQYTSNIPVPDTSRAAVPAYRPGAATSSTRDPPTPQFVAPHILHTAPSPGQGGQPSQPRNDQASSLPGVHLSLAPIAGVHRCKWQKHDRTACNMRLDDLSQGGVNRHMRDFHGFDPSARAYLYCQWEDCRHENPLMPSSIGKHVSARHLGDANTLKCNYCEQTFTRSDAGMRHVRNKHPERIQDKPTA